MRVVPPMSDPWNFSGESPSLQQPGGIVTLVEGSAFCISGRSGDVAPGSLQGLIFQDTRFLSRLELRVNGRPVEVLSVAVHDPFSATFVGRSRSRSARSESALMIFRRRYIGRGMREDITIRNFGEEAAYCSLETLVDADFADLFEVKEGRVLARPEGHTVESVDGVVEIKVRRGATRRGVRVSFGEHRVQVIDNVAAFDVIVPARGEWHTCMQVTPVIEGEEVEPRHLCGDPVERAAPVEQLAKWRRHVPEVETDHRGLRELITQSAEDLGALRIFDPEHPERAVVAAGAPWFMTLFGRDSIITSWMALIVDPDLALGVLQTLARFQGEQIDPRNEEEPGRILHEIRFGASASLSLGGGQVYYGTADATPLFVMLLGELRRWGLARHAVDALLPHADRAMAWIEEFGDRDGDGYVEYKRTTDRGLVNQGWKDSWDAIRFADGELARPPIALCEVQGYVYAAYLARAHFAEEVGDVEVAERYRDKAAHLKEAFNRDFWLPDKGWFAMGLDGAKRQIDALGSNMGHCLWTGIIDEDKAHAVAKHLLSEQMFSGWGIRTLSQDMVGYNPLSYHNGSVWPHDNAIAAAGLMRYGFVEEAHRVITGQIEAGMAMGGRLPELFSGLSRTDFGLPLAYPTSCSPQAWAAASPLLFLRTLLRLDPWAPHGRVWLDPALPGSIHRLRVNRVPLAGHRVQIAVDDEVTWTGLPAEVVVMREPRYPLTAEA